MYTSALQLQLSWIKTKQQPLVLSNEAIVECQKLQFIELPLEAGSKRESIPIDAHVKMLNFTAELNIFPAWYKNGFGLPIAKFPLYDNYNLPVL